MDISKIQDTGLTTRKGPPLTSYSPHHECFAKGLAEPLWKSEADSSVRCCPGILTQGQGHCRLLQVSQMPVISISWLLLNMQAPGPPPRGSNFNKNSGSVPYSQNIT